MGEKEWLSKAKWALVATAPLIIFSYLTESLVGLLVLTVGLYFLAPYAFGVDPTFRGIFDLAESLSTESKLAIIGIVAGYVFALITWRRQKRIELALSAADEIWNFYQEANHHALTLYIFAENLIETKKAVDEGGLEKELWRYFSLKNGLEKAIEAQERLSFMGRTVFALSQKHQQILNSSFLAHGLLPKAEKQLSELSRAGTYFIPRLDFEPAVALSFFRQMDDKKWKSFMALHDKTAVEMVSRACGVTGAFQSQLIAPNTASIWGHFRLLSKLCSLDKDKE